MIILTYSANLLFQPILALFERAELLELVHTSVHFCVRVSSAAYTFAVRVAGASAASVTSCKNFLPLLGDECNWVQTIDSRAALSVYVWEKGVIDGYRWRCVLAEGNKPMRIRARAARDCTKRHCDITATHTSCSTLHFQCR